MPDLTPLASSRIGSTVRILALAVLATLLWAAANGRLTSFERWAEPTQHVGDALEVLARIKAASEGDLTPFLRKRVERLAAPFGADWTEYPVSDGIVLFLFGQLSKVAGLGLTANLALVFAQIASTLSFYFCARVLRYRRAWAFAGALLFAFTYHNVFRGLGHLMQVFAFTVPLGLLTTWLVGGSRLMQPRDRFARICYGSAVLLGIGNPYNLYLFLQLLGWSLVVQWLRDRRRENLRVGMICFGLAVVSFAAVHADTLFLGRPEGASRLIYRNYAGTEYYALKPVEFFIPPADHRLPVAAFFGHRYVRWSTWKGEVFSPYLGIVGAAGLIWMTAEFIARIFRRRPRRITSHAPQALWIIGFSAIGGINNLLAFYGGLHVFRATNRFSVFISALALLFLVSRLSRLSRNHPRWAVVSGAALLAAIGLFDQIPRPMPPSYFAGVSSTYQSDREFGRALEKALPAQALVFQLPQLDFPEASPPGSMRDYEHFRLYLFTETLRYSYGALRARARAHWQRELQGLPVEELVRRLERFGFAALHINRNGFEDEADDLLFQLQQIGRKNRLISPQGDHVAVLLQPASEPALPLARRPTFGRGWNRGPPEPGGPIRRSWGSAALSYYNPFPHEIEAAIALDLSSVGSRTVRVKLNGRELWRGSLADEITPLRLAGVRLSPGVNRIDLRTPEPAVRVSQRPFGLHAIGVHHLEIRPVGTERSSLLDAQPVEASLLDL